MQMLLVDIQDGYKVIDINDELTEYYKNLKCSTIDITMRKVEGRWFDIICDDEGLFAEKPQVSAIQKKTMSPALVGNLIFAHHNAEGKMTALSDEDVKILKKNIIRMYDITSGENHDVILID